LFIVLQGSMMTTAFGARLLRAMREKYAISASGANPRGRTRCDASLAVLTSVVTLVAHPPPTASAATYNIQCRITCKPA
jgi:hypothetical protein